MNKHCHAQAETKLLSIFKFPFSIAVFKQDIAFLEEVCHWGGGLSLPLLLPVTFRSDVSSLLQYHACLPSAILPAMMIMD